MGNFGSCFSVSEKVSISQQHYLPLTYLTLLRAGSKTLILCGTPDPFTAESTLKELLTALILLFLPLMLTCDKNISINNRHGSNITCWRQWTAAYGATEILQFLGRKRVSISRYNLGFHKNHIETEKWELQRNYCLTLCTNQIQLVCCFWKENKCDRSFSYSELVVVL